MTNDRTPGETMTTSEEARLDGLLTAARGFHHLSCVVAGVAVVLASVAQLANVQVPGAGLTLPRAPAAVALFVVSIILTAAADRMFRMAYPWLDKDPRRIRFAWYPLGADAINPSVMTLWLLAPLLTTAVAAATALGTIASSALLLPGFYIAFMPRLTDRYIPLITKRLDHRGGSATFSIWLLYWYRIARHLSSSVALMLFVVASIPEYRATVLPAAFGAVTITIILYVLRGAGDYCYRWLDRVGTRWGFPAVNHQHSGSTSTSA